MKNIIKIFEEIRDTPLSIPLNSSEEDNRCWGKSRRLKELLENEGYKVRFRVCSFKWSKQNFPKEVLDILHNDDETHLFLEVQINGKWVILDCANDSKLPKYNNWDGLTDCNVTVNYEKIFSPKESLELEFREKEDFLLKLKQNKNFYSAINNFFNLIRKIN